MGGVDEFAAVEAGDQHAGALVAALALAEDSGNGVVGLAECVDRLDEALSGPGVVGQIKNVVHARSLEAIQIDRHAVGDHAEGIASQSAVRDSERIQRGGDDLAPVRVVEHVAQIDHVALGAPLHRQALGTLHDHVGRFAGGDRRVDLVVAVAAVGQELDLDLDAGFRFKRVGEGLDRGLIAPLADGICPQTDLAHPGGVVGAGVAVGVGAGVAAAAGRQCEHHDQRQRERNCFLHFVSSFK